MRMQSDQAWESIQTWINRQGWPEEVEVEALLLVQEQVNNGLNPFTGSQWKRWAAERGL